MKELLVIAVLAAPPAFAQGGYNPAGDILPVAIGLGALELGLVASSVVTAAGTTAYRGPGWIASSYVSATFNTLMTTGFVFGAFQTARGSLGKPDPMMVAGAIGHGMLTLWNLLAPTLVLASNTAEPSVAPLAMGGRDRAGRRWAGLGIQISGL